MLFVFLLQQLKEDSLILQFCKQRDKVGFVCVAGVLSKYKSWIKDLAPLENKHLLLVSTTTLNMGFSIKIGFPLKQKGQSPDLHHVLPCKSLSLFQQLTYQVAIPWHSSCENGSLDALTVACGISQTYLQ